MNDSSPPQSPHEPHANDRIAFASALQDALQNGQWQRLILSKPRTSTLELRRVAVRPIVVRGRTALSFVYSYPTRDITQNLDPGEGLARIADILSDQMRHAHLLTPPGEIQLLVSKKGRWHLIRPSPDRPAAQTPVTPTQGLSAQAHDRAKHRTLDIHRPFLAALGVTTPDGRLVPTMARKWKQINKFLEIFQHALDSSALADAPKLRVVDFGAGKAYLSFALHDWLRHTRQQQAEVIGVELREDLVQQGQGIVAELGLQGMRLQQGDVRDWPVGRMDVMVALHACDTATDHAIHLGIRSGAQLILCSPCCHKQLRPQLLSPHPLRSVFQHGIHAEQQAEMLTDSLRALLLEAQGYDTQVFEFVALEHTRKNKMILAVKRRAPRPPEAALQQVDELKRFFGIREHCLESLLATA